jgi:serine/threonine-protein kinase RsbW
VARQIVSLKIAGELRHRDVALRTVSAACRLTLGPHAHEPTGRRALHEIVSAVGEAFNNIAIHGYHDRARGLVDIRVAARDDRVTIEMRDYGHSFDPRTAVPPDLDAMPESGMGVFIMSRFVDEVSYRPGCPNLLRLVKHLT